MSLIVIRFPDGTKEFQYPERDLVEGDVVWHQGDPYRVIHVMQDGGPPTATVEPDSDDMKDLLGSERGGIQLVPAD